MIQSFKGESVPVVSLVDFGFAKISEEGDAAKKACELHDAPEVKEGHAHTSKSDMWSVGVLIYTMICGKKPFETAEEIGEKKLEFGPDFTDEERELIEACLSVDSSARPDAKDLAGKDCFQHLMSPREKVDMTEQTKKIAQEMAIMNVRLVILISPESD